MILLKGITNDHLYDIAEAFADAFMSEEGIVSRCLDEKDAVEYFHMVLKEYEKRSCLYASSEKEEGYIVFFPKGQGLPWYSDLYLSVASMFRMDLIHLQKMILCRNGWTDYTVYHMNTPDYVDISLVCVRRQYQHQGIFRELLRVPFEIGIENRIPVILDTDSELKMKKYRHEGMWVEKDALLESGIHMYTMIYSSEYTE